MIRRINKYLLLRYPLLWNTKFVWAALSVLLLNILFYFSGLGSLSSLEELHNEYNFQLRRAHESVFLLFLLLACLFFIVWFIFYFQSNRFKSFYPTSKVHLFKEFLLVLILSTGICHVYNSYEAGYRHKVLSLGKDFNLQEQASIVNQANCFLPFNQNEFELDNCCDSVDARANREAERTSAYADWECDHYYASNTTPDQQPPRTKLYYSYLYYCGGNPIYLDSTDSRIYVSKAHTWLKQKNKDKIKEVLSKLKVVCNAYKIKENLDVDLLTNWCFLDDSCSVLNTIGRNSYDDIDQGHSHFIHMDELYTIIHTIEENRNYSYFNHFSLYIVLYFGLCITLCIMAFRLTGLKPWLIAFVGFIVVIIVFNIVVQFFPTPRAYESIALCFELVFFVLCTLFILKKWFKNIGGTLLIWFMMGLPILVPVLFNKIYLWTQQITQCVDHKWQIVYEAPPINFWIADNWPTINFINIGFVISAFFLFIIPMAIKWQANPEE